MELPSEAGGMGTVSTGLASNVSVWKLLWFLTVFIKEDITQSMTWLWEHSKRSYSWTDSGSGLYQFAVV